MNSLVVINPNSSQAHLAIVPMPALAPAQNDVTVFVIV